MLRSYFIVWIMIITLLTSCKDKISNSSDEPQTIRNSISEESCDSSTSYDGIQEISDVTDTTAKVIWEVDPESIGYALFKSNGDNLELVKSFAANESSYVTSGLAVETNHRFLVRSINNQGRFDCNENFEEFTTTEKQTFLSCNEIHEYYLGVKPSGVYKIDTDLSGPKLPIDVYCDMDNNSGGWTRVFTHNTTAGLFANDTDAKEKNIGDTSADKYSILSKLSDFKRNGKFEFWLYYPEHDGVDGGNIWTQTSNPVTDLIAGYVAIRETYSGMYWGGLEKSNYPGTLIDGSVGYGWWFYAIGSHKYWVSTGTIPGPLRSTAVTRVQLFVK